MKSSLKTIIFTAIMAISCSCLAMDQTMPQTIQSASNLTALDTLAQVSANIARNEEVRRRTAQLVIQATLTTKAQAQAPQAIAQMPAMHAAAQPPIASLADAARAAAQSNDAQAPAQQPTIAAAFSNQILQNSTEFNAESSYWQCRHDTCTIPVPKGQRETHLASHLGIESFGSPENKASLLQQYFKPIIRYQYNGLKKKLGLTGLTRKRSTESRTNPTYKCTFPHQHYVQGKKIKGLVGLNITQKSGAARNDQCKGTYSYLGHKTHIFNTLGIKPYSCAGCQTYYSAEANFNRHKKDEMEKKQPNCPNPVLIKNTAMLSNIDFLRFRTIHTAGTSKKLKKQKVDDSSDAASSSSAAVAAAASASQ